MPRRKNCTCGRKIIEYPIYDGQEEGKPLVVGETLGERFKSLKRHKWYWRNLIIGDWTRSLVLITLLVAAVAYAHDTAVVRKINENPCSFVEKNYNYCFNENQEENQSYTIGENLIITPYNASTGGG